MIKSKDHVECAVPSVGIVAELITRNPRRFGDGNRLILI